MKIRIAVAVDEAGRWEAVGLGYASKRYEDPSDEQNAKRARGSIEDCGEDDAIHEVFVEADVPLSPAPVVVEGTVTE